MSTRSKLVDNKFILKPRNLSKTYNPPLLHLQEDEYIATSGNPDRIPEPWKPIVDIDDDQIPFLIELEDSIHHDDPDDMHEEQHDDGMDHHGELDETQEEEQPDYTQNHEYSTHSSDSDGRNELRSSSSQPPSEETTFENAAQPNLSDDIPPLHGAHAVGDHDHGQAIVLYEEGQHPYDQEKLIQDRKPKRNDRIAFFHPERRCWITATLTSFELKGPNLENYYNIRYADGTEDGVYLIKDERWTFLDDNDAGAGIGQLDGGCTPES